VRVTGLLIETLLGGLGALLVLVVVFASPLAIVPLAVAAVSILTTFLVLRGLTAAFTMSIVVQFLVGLIGPGVAIDHSLLLIVRWREERDGGAGDREAVERAVATAGHAILVSGTTVAIGLVAMVAVPVPFIRSIGVGGLLIPLVSVLVTLTLLPGLLLAFGLRLDRRRRGGPR
jgi:RND superfamily putative drug exporter